MKEGLSPNELASAQHRMAVTARIVLRDKAHAIAQCPARAGISGLVPRADAVPNLLTPAPAASSRMICRADFDSPFWSISIWSGNLRCWGLAAVIRAFRTFMGGVGARERQPDCDLGLEQSQ